MQLTGEQIEAHYLAVLDRVRDEVSIPIAMKLNSFFSAIPNMAAKLDQHGADGLVLFNRFYQPDLDIEALESRRKLVLSSSDEMRLPLRWIAILYGQLNASLALTTGVHTSEDVIKAMMAGASIANVCSVLLEYGIDRLTPLVDGVQAWLSQHDYESVAEVRGILSHKESPNPAAFERANYVKLVGQTEV
jgi:dihydroorotate dehydrogenase (fumarate)